MVDNINLQKILFPASSASKIKALEKKHGHTRDRNFKRHLEKEKDEDERNNEEEWRLNNDKESYINKQKKRKAGSDDHSGHETTKSETENKCMKRIDIVV
ncbi:MAG: hypothetical protein JRJ20_01075 [Deltaproteobacteria bacterium]|jgi:hypothetical protein|nr:hypothetical protein [Deltaproteobacteria bacterium]MBW2143742.1 hypothetical protein [Deltaproteobacteria bacterium]